MQKRDFLVDIKHWLWTPKDYMSAVADALLEAKEEIFIADWWLTPEIYMKRGHNEAKANLKSHLNYYFNILGLFRET